MSDPLTPTRIAALRRFVDTIHGGHGEVVILDIEDAEGLVAMAEYLTAGLTPHQRAIVEDAMNWAGDNSLPETFDKALDLYAVAAEQWSLGNKLEVVTPEGKCREVLRKQASTVDSLGRAVSGEAN